ncbi:Uma2 family endonuclease [Streptomyces sp. NPDC059477]|uniref:Uma2 family endonuclease n=1 Tax=Streptomyces sp. NPDC059477 TaxID=3346847 RepID=UPI003689CECB
MSAEPITEPVMTQQDPADLLIAIEEASETPIRPEYVEGTVIVPPQPNEHHNDTAYALTIQFLSAGFSLVGVGNGYRAAYKDGTSLGLVVPDFYVRRRKASELDESYLAAHKGWYPIDMLALVGEVTSTNHETDTGAKARIYAAAGVPVYVLINRNTQTAHSFSDPILPDDGPARAYYATETKVPLGERLPLPAPYPALDTAL